MEKIKKENIIRLFLQLDISLPECDWKRHEKDYWLLKIKEHEKYNEKILLIQNLWYLNKDWLGMDYTELKTGLDYKPLKIMIEYVYTNTYQNLLPNIAIKFSPVELFKNCNLYGMSKEDIIEKAINAYTKDFSISQNFAGFLEIYRIINIKQLGYIEDILKSYDEEIESIESNESYTKLKDFIFNQTDE